MPLRVRSEIQEVLRQGHVALIGVRVATEDNLLHSGRPGARKTAESDFLFRCYSHPNDPDMFGAEDHVIAYGGW